MSSLSDLTFSQLLPLLSSSLALKPFQSRTFCLSGSLIKP